MTTPSDRIPEFSPNGERRYGREPVAADPDRPRRHLDDETREVVDTFEALYAAELSSSPPAQPPQQDIAGDDDLLIDLPHEFARTVPGRDAARSGPERSGRDGALRDAGRARAPQRASESPPALDIDDAYAVLQAAETKARANAARDAVDRDEDDAPVQASLPVPAVRRERSRSTGPARSAPPDWTARARAMWPRLAGAALIALVVGAGLGYLVGRSPATPAPQATIPVTPEGTAKLQFDYDLQAR